MVGDRRQWRPRLIYRVLCMHGPISTRTSFHFKVFTNGEAIHDSDPLMFSDLEEVWQEGAMSSCELIQAMHGRIDSELDWRLDVSNDTGQVIYRFSFRAERL